MKFTKVGNLKEFTELISILNHAVLCKSISKEFAKQTIQLVADTLFRGKITHDILEK